MKLSFEDIIAKKPFEPFDQEIAGLGTVTLHPLSSVDAALCITESKGLEGEELEQHIAKWCCRMLKSKDATESEIRKFRQHNMASVITDIYLKGLAGNAMGAESKEVIEKNS